MTDTGPTDQPPTQQQPGTDVAPREPWHQLPTETETAYAHFRHYLHMERGRRSLRRAAEDRGVSAATLADLSALHQWVARVQAHDRHLDVIEDAEFEAEKRRIARDAARAAGSALQASNAAIRAGVLGLQPYLEPGTADAHGIVRNAHGVPVQRLDANQALAALRAGTRSAVAAKQLVTDRDPVARGSDGTDLDEAGVEEVAHGLDVWDLAQLLVTLTTTSTPGVMVDSDVVDAPTVD